MERKKTAAMRLVLVAASPRSTLNVYNNPAAGLVTVGLFYDAPAANSYGLFIVYHWFILKVLLQGRKRQSRAALQTSVFRGALLS